MTNDRVQVVCGRSGESHYVEPDYLPDADEYRATCACGRCSAAEYREPEAL